MFVTTFVHRSQCAQRISVFEAMPVDVDGYERCFLWPSSFVNASNAELVSLQYYGPVGERLTTENNDRVKYTNTCYSTLECILLCVIFGNLRNAKVLQCRDNSTAKALGGVSDGVRHFGKSRLFSPCRSRQKQANNRYDFYLLEFFIVTTRRAAFNGYSAVVCAPPHPICWSSCLSAP